MILEIKTETTEEVSVDFPLYMEWGGYWMITSPSDCIYIDADRTMKTYADNEDLVEKCLEEYYFKGNAIPLSYQGFWSKFNEAQDYWNKIAAHEDNPRKTKETATVTPEMLKQAMQGYLLLRRRQIEDHEGLGVRLQVITDELKILEKIT